MEKPIARSRGRPRKRRREEDATIVDDPNLLLEAKKTRPVALVIVRQLVELMLFAVTNTCELVMCSNCKNNLFAYGTKVAYIGSPPDLNCRNPSQ
ncbi:hypothetical protein RJT34_07575 [Clitoria ternatea]|uniref:Uncharacterized protein n=1 Tax=Clitoria ternatea TaxID=43366 RepID=A0AAN9K3J8_CLITE